MRSVFSPDGAVALRRAVETRALLVFDFDGTLAPIVDDPADAVTPRETAELIQMLLGHFQVAVVSGRSLRDLESRLGFDPTFLVGNHGAEGAGAPPPSPCEPSAAWMRERVAAAAARLEAAGVSFEDKERSWTLHYRMAADHERARQEIRRLLDPLDPQLHVFEGKCCVNVVLADAWHKGRAVEALVARTGASSVVFMGDDVTDESVYRVSRPSWLTIHVGNTTHTTDAGFFVDTQREVANVLRLLHDLAVSMAR
ncbi:trehalose-phosphatase [Sphaerotilaceae bacterium SBD11-9]